MIGKPTYEATDYVLIHTTKSAKRMCEKLINLSVFFVVEPLDGDSWNFYVKKEAIGEIKIIAKEINKGLEYV